MTSEMATAVDFGIISNQALFQIMKLSDDKYLLFIMTHFLLKIGPKSSLQSGTELFSDSWQGIGVRVLNCDTFFHHEELQNSRRSFYDKRLPHILPQNGSSPVRLVF